MLLKLMDRQGPDDGFDNDPLRGFRIMDNVQDVRFHHLSTGQASLDVRFGGQPGEARQEDFVLQGNAYLMNSQGKTVEVFSANLHPNRET